ncbi:hypothetical protein Pfo_023449 [Paulownia fortunei]|nr:hypothetical protein Pfo_023449 [Paulownia fortunei]
MEQIPTKILELLSHCLLLLHIQCKQHPGGVVVDCLKCLQGLVDNSSYAFYCDLTSPTVVLEAERELPCAYGMLGSIFCRRVVYDHSSLTIKF